MKAPSLTLRLTLLFAAVSTGVILVLGFMVGAAVERHFVEQDMEVLGGRLAQAREAIHKAVLEQDLAALPERLDDVLAGHRGLAIAVLAPDGSVVFATRDAGFPHELLDSPVGEGEPRPSLWTGAWSVPYRGFSAKVPWFGGGQATVAIATDISHHEAFMDAFRLNLRIFVLVAALVSGLFGWLAVRRGLVPLQEIRRRAEAITAQRLDARLEVEAVPVELADLAQTLNKTFARLETSFRRLTDFSSDLAHEFRSPVSNLLTQAQVTLSRPRSVEEYREVLASSIEEYERLSRMIADMLLIAQAEEGQWVPSAQSLDLSRMMSELIEFYGVAAEERGISLRLSGEAQAVGDALMIRRAVGNLLSNALRHTSLGAWVSVTLGMEDACAIIDVCNAGETIPPSDLPRLFDRFFRADAARSGHEGQTGLGLSLVRSIIEAHRGEVLVSSENGVTCFRLRLPAPGGDFADPDKHTMI